MESISDQGSKERFGVSACVRIANLAGVGLRAFADTPLPIYETHSFPLSKIDYSLAVRQLCRCVDPRHKLRKLVFEIFSF
jgi:hypothetical protein